VSAGRWVAGLTFLALTGVSLVRPGPAPRLGPLADPVHGIWSVAASADPPASARVRIPGLVAPVQVAFDDRAVPHIFARNELDALRALGYVVARDRLFQLELQWRAGAGRLTELVGAAALPVDRESRGLGLPDAARARYAALPPQARDRRLLEAFSEGVNARIAGLTAREIPLEYHLLDRRPAPWEPVDSYYLLARMGWTLAYSDLEDTRARAAALVGDAAADALYPRESPIQEPIQPNGAGAPRFDLPPLPPPGLSGTARRPGIPPLLAAARRRPDGLEADAIGSNNWAVAPARSADGNALLAGDPHLELTLPSIWYEAHLVVPDSLDVYGVTIPGATGIVIGFTRALAWTFTNAEADVLDRYAEVVDAPDAPTRYRVDGAWRPLRVVTEAYRDRGGALLRADTLRYTHRGPLLRAADGWQSLRWTVLEAGGEQGIFGRAARAADARAWLDSMAGYRAPAQNMLVADRGGTIAIRSTGRFPPPARRPRRPRAPRRHQRQRLDRGVVGGRDAPGHRPRAGVPRLGQPAAGGSTGRPALPGRQLVFPVAGPAHQCAAARRQRGHPGRDAALPDRPRKRGRRPLRAGLPGRGRPQPGARFRGARRAAARVMGPSVHPRQQPRHPL
jgi:penicillin amidase